MFDNDEAESLAANLESNVELLTAAISDGDVVEAKTHLTSIGLGVQAIRSELDSLPTTTDVGESEPAGV